MKIYVLKSGDYKLHIEGLWTDLDQMLDWIGDQMHTWDERTDETDLEVFMRKHQVDVYPSDGGPGEQIDWQEIIPH